MPLASSLLRIVAEPPAAGNSDAVTSIVVAVLTFKRPGELAEFLEHFARIERPARCRLMLLVVDNDAKASAREVVAAWQERIPGLRYVVRIARPMALQQRFPG